MPDNTKKPEQPTAAAPMVDKIADLPERPVSDRDADAVKAGRNKLDPPIG